MIYNPVTDMPGPIDVTVNACKLSMLVFYIFDNTVFKSYTFVILTDVIDNNLMD